MKLSVKIGLIILTGEILGVVTTYFLLSPLTSDLVDPSFIFFLLSLASVPFSLIMWGVIYKLTVSPILRLNKVSSIIGKGNLSKRVEIKSSDEIGELAYNFNTVINNLTSGLQSMANSLRNEKTKEKELAASYKELDKEKAQDDALLTSIGDAVIAINNDQKIILFNEAASKMVGIDSKTATGVPYHQILRFEDEATHAQASDFIQPALKGEEESKSRRIMLRRMNGDTMPILHTTSPILNNTKEIIGVVVILKDITKERELEKLKDEFVSLASHELRTPMTAIKGLISMIMEGDYGNMNEGLKDPLSDVAQSTDRLIQLVNDMLDVSRIEAGRTKIRLTEILLPELVSDVIKTLKPIAQQKNITLNSEESVINKVNADPDKVKQILINLINNAIKFTDRGNVTINYRPWGKFAYISVVDSGIGIAKEDQAKLFEKFSQISNFSSGRPPGTGLGLYISRAFARKMGGEMWITRSEPGKGSTFTFALPFVENVI